MRLVPVLIAATAGVIDWRTRRIPNWLTMSSLAAGIAANTLFHGWSGAKESLLGAGLGLVLLLPFVLIRSLGAGDWKLVGALGGWVGPSPLLAILFATILIAGLMAVIMVILKGRFLQTLRNLGHMIAALVSLHLPGQELTLDNPQSSKIPFGVAVAVAMALYAVQGWRVL